MQNDLTIQQNDFSTEDIQLIKETVCKGSTDTEFKLFINQARKTGLNPLARQVFAVKRWDSSAKREVMSIQVSIDGFRLIAERTGKYAGQVGPYWCGEDGEWKDAWLSDKPPVAARVGTLRSDFKEPCWGVARFNAYAQRKKEGDLTKMWATMPDVMIAKCAESLALRKAFPQELSGLYTNDEMGQTENETEAKTSAPQYKVQAPSLKSRAEALLNHMEKLKTSVSVTNLVASNNSLLWELKEAEPALYNSISSQISKIQEGFQITEAAE